MAKTISAGMRTHLDGTVTTLATLWKITRTDSLSLYFTDHDVDISYDDGGGTNTYLAATGYNRTAVVNATGLNVDNLDIEGIIDSETITEEDLRAGKFDFADIEVRVVNWADLSDGDIKMRKGTLGEIVLTPQGVYKVELRGLTQRLSQNIVDPYQPDCRTDLGSSLCKIPIQPNLRGNLTAYSVGATVRAPTRLTGNTWDYMCENPSFERDTPGAALTSLEDWTVSSGTWDIISGAADERDQYLEANADGSITQTITLEDYDVDLVSLDAGNATMAITIARGNSGANSDTGRMVVSFLDDALGPISTMWDSTATSYGAGGWADENSGNIAVPGTTRYIQMTYTSAGGNAEAKLDDIRLSYADTTITNTFQDEYENVYYECTVAGTTAASQPVMNTTISGTTVDGSVTWTARNAWMRSGDIFDVIDNQTFNLDVSEGRAVDDWFNSGVVIFETGDNAGNAIEVKDWVNTDNVLSIFLPAPYTIVTGTKVRLYPGCDKRLETCRDKFSNTINFRGEPYVPGSDEIQKYPDARG